MFKKISILIAILLFCCSFLISQDTYKIDKTEYYYGKYYSTTGKPYVKRSATNRREFLKSQGYEKVPEGYEVDHIIPLSKGGTDDSSNMQLLTIEQHAEKTAKERANSSNLTHLSYPTYRSSSTYSPSLKYKSPSNYLSRTGTYNGRTIHTGKNGGKYYINRNGNKTYVKSDKSSSKSSSSKSSNRSTYTPSYSNPSYSSNRTIHTGSRGGKYYINSNGNKTYIKKKN